MEYKGQLEGFPQEVVEWMLDQQEKQGNERDVSAFERYRCAGYDGFHWNVTEEGAKFCEDVILHERFDLFFERYPKKEEEKLMTFPDTYKIGALVETKREPSYIEVVTQIVCAYIANDKYGNLTDPMLVNYSKQLADDIFKQCNK